MITKWKLFNFKSVQEETELDLGPLTILAGSNSSGKSTVLQSILLISQTLSSKVPSRSVVLNGPLMKLGQFDDLRSYDGEANQILIGWECRPQEIDSRRNSTLRNASDARIYYGARSDLKTVACELSFEADPSSPQRDLLQLHPQLFGCTLDAESNDPRTGRARLSVNRAQKDPTEKAADFQIKDAPAELLSLLEYDVVLDAPGERDFWDDLVSVEPVGCGMNHFLPNRLAIRYDSVEEKANLISAVITDTYLRRFRRRNIQYQDLIVPAAVIEIIRERLGEPLAGRLFDRVQLSLFSEGEFTLEEFTRQVHQLKREDRLLLRAQLDEDAETLAQEIRQAMASELGEKYELTQRPLTGEIRAATNYLNWFFSSQVKYLGPLRDEPKALYPLASNVDPTDIGYRGEHTAAVFDLHKANFVDYIPAKAFAEPDIELRRQPGRRGSTRTLETAVFDWLTYMGVADKLVTRDRGKLGHELKVTTPGTSKPHDLTHVGVGVSQVLPILVMCLLAEPDTTIIIEQPELHLHPKVQTLLGDFFLSMALLGKQIIVETHSEYIINRLRFRAAAAPDDRIASQLKIYFAEKKGGASHFREVNVNQYGAIMDWPEGFFDQSQAEAEEILRAATRKRKATREKERNAQRNH